MAYLHLATLFTPPRLVSHIPEGNTNDSLTSAHDVELIDQLSEKSPIATLEPYVIATRQSNTSKSQNLIKTSSMDKNQRVLYCTKVDREVDYEFMYEELKSHGSIERIKMILDEDSNTYDAYVTFAMNSAALSALQAVKEIGNVPCKLLNTKNVADSACDFIPSKLGLCENKIKRESPPPVWFVAQYKEGLQNKALAALNLERKVGNIDPKNLKNYGKNLLIKAGNKTQAGMLSTYKPPENGNIERVTPHKTFNSIKGVIFSRDLYVFSELELLQLCPANVCKVEKLPGQNHAILLHFSGPLPYDIWIEHCRLSQKI